MRNRYTPYIWYALGFGAAVGMTASLVAFAWLE